MLTTTYTRDPIACSSHSSTYIPFDILLQIFKHYPYTGVIVICDDKYKNKSNKAISPGHWANYIFALGSFCHDQNRFHLHDSNSY